MSCWHCAKALCAKAVARGMLITRIPAEWKHPVGKPTGEDDAFRISVTALVEGTPICTSLSHPSKAQGEMVAPLASPQAS